MARWSTLLVFSFFACVLGQQPGILTAESAPPLIIRKCAAGGTCVFQSASVTLDASWRWIHSTSDSTNCYDTTSNTWNSTICIDPLTCAEKCAVDGANYSGTYGIATSGNAITLKFVTHSSSNTNIGSRVFLKSSVAAYQLFNLKAQEFTFDVDLSSVPCGLDASLFIVGMDADGGLSKYPSTKAGAKYGTGYCDAKCPHDVKFIDGEANLLDWDPITETGLYGSCCGEIDLLEGNSAAGVFTAHPCNASGQTRCQDTACGADGICDNDGCDYNPWRLGNQQFFGTGLKVNTQKPFTVITRFITNDGTPTGTLSEIQRIYVQNGVVIQNSVVNVPGVPAYSSITNQYCAAEKAAFGDQDTFTYEGGLLELDSWMSRGMVLAMGIGDDRIPGRNMNWLDSNYPASADPSTPGVSRGPCAVSAGTPAIVEAEYAAAAVVFSNIKYGPIGSTATSIGPQTPNTVAHYGQCGGTGYAGLTTCASPYTCQVVNASYSECL